MTLIVGRGSGGGQQYLVISLVSHCCIYTEPVCIIATYDKSKDGGFRLSCLSRPARLIVTVLCRQSCSVVGGCSEVIARNAGAL